MMTLRRLALPLVGIALMASVAFAQDAPSDEWMDDPSLSLPPAIPYGQTMDPLPRARKNAANTSPKSGEANRKPGFFQKLFGAKEAPPPSENTVVNVGPRELPPSTDVLLRIPMAIQGQDGQLLRPGFYLARRQAEGPQFLLFQQGRQCLTLPLQPVGKVSTGPVEPLSGKTPPKAEVSVEKGHLVFTWTEAARREATAPIPTRP